MAEKRVTKPSLVGRKAKQSRTCVWFNEEQNKFVDKLIGSTLGNDRTEVVKQIVMNYLRDRFRSDSDFKG